MPNIFPIDPPLRPDFAEFVIYEKVILPHELETIAGLWKSGQEEKATISSDEVYDDDLRQSAVVFLDPGEKTDWIYRKISMFALECNATRYAFDLSGYQQPLQLTKYQEGDFFDWHLDFAAGPVSHRKLSITVQLSDPDSYEGGDLQFQINQNRVDAPRTRGTVVVFPSFILHRVTPVTRGERMSIVGWISGPPYR